MSTCSSFSKHSLPPINIKKYSDKQINTIKRLPDFADYDSGNAIDPTTYPFEDKIRDLLTITLTKAKVLSKRDLKLILNAPGTKISFEKLEINKMDVLSTVSSFINDLSPDFSQEYAEDIIETIIPLFARCKFESLNCNLVCDFISTLSKTLKYNVIADVVGVRCLMYQLQTNFNNESFISPIANKINELILRIYNSRYAKYTIPFIAPQMAELIYKNLHKLPSKQQNNIEQLANCTTIPKIFVLLATIYPPALEAINWQKYVSYLLEVIDFYQPIVPDHTYYLNFPGQCFFPQPAENISALMAAMAHLTNIDPEADRDFMLRIVHVIASNNRSGQMAVAQAFINIAKYDEFHEIYALLKDLILCNNLMALQILFDILDNNFTELSQQIFQYYDLGSMNFENLPEVIQGHLKHIKFMHSPDPSLSGNIMDNVRTVDALLKLDPSKFYEITSIDKTINKLMQYILSLMKSGSAIVDIRNAPAFVHLCASTVDLIFKYRTADEKQIVKPSPIDPYFLLAMYDQIALVGKPIVGEKSFEANSLEAMFFEDRLRIARNFIDYETRFLNVAITLVDSDVPSMGFALLLFLNDLLLISKNRSFVNQLSSSFLNWMIMYAKSESPIVQGVATSAAKLFGSAMNRSKMNELLDLIIPELRYLESDATKTVDRKKYIGPLRILLFLTQITSVPAIKDTMLETENLERFITGPLLHGLRLHWEKEPNVLMLCADILLNLCSHSITSVAYLDESLRHALMTVKASLIPKIVASVASLLDIKHLPKDVVACVKILRLFRYLMDNPYYVEEAKRIDFKISIANLPEAVYANDDFAPTAVEMAYAVSKTDVEYAKYIIDFAHSEKLIREDQDKFGEDTPEVEMLLRNIEQAKPKVPVPDLKACQAIKASRGLNAGLPGSEALPPKTSTDYLLQLRDSENSDLYFKTPVVFAEGEN